MLVKPTIGEDYAVNKPGPYAVDDYIKTDESEQIVEIEVKKQARWDIDQLKLRFIVKRRRLRSWVHMLFGAVISSLVGVLFELRL